MESDFSKILWVYFLNRFIAYNKEEIEEAGYLHLSIL